MSEQGITTSGQEWPQQHMGPDGTTYWVDSAGQVFSAVIHMGPEDDNLGADDMGLWVTRPQPRRRGRPRRVREAQKTILRDPLCLDPPARPVPDAVWVVWYHANDMLETVGAFADPVEALERLIDTPAGRVSRALIR